MSWRLTTRQSPRWLIASDRPEEARRVLANAHAGGDENSPLVNFEVSEIEATLKSEKQAAASSNYIDMLKTKGNRHRLLISISLGIFCQWSGNG